MIVVEDAFDVVHVLLFGLILIIVLIFFCFSSFISFIKRVGEDYRFFFFFRLFLR
ncbi:MAG: hypothetical protein HZT42_10065 [Paracoccaceae bacterium]|nr:MAG: hypothetical protein HZT42_10065 [Paracoccaceae bacterium]